AKLFILALGLPSLDGYAIAHAHFLAPASVRVGYAVALRHPLAVLDFVAPAARRLLALRGCGGRVTRRRGERDHAEQQRFCGGFGHYTTPHCSLYRFGGEPGVKHLVSSNISNRPLSPAFH